MKRKELDRRMEAENVSQLKYMLEMVLYNLRERTDIDLNLFMGVDGRIFASSIPDDLTPPQYSLLSTFRSNLPNLCGKLKVEDLEISLERWKGGTAIVASVGENAFLSSLMLSSGNLTDMGPLIEDVVNTTIVLNHIFGQKPMSEEILSTYPDTVQDELKKLTRQLFVERFKHTRQYKKNMKVLEFIKDKIKKSIGVGQVEQIVSVTFNELGTSAPYMDDESWQLFLDKVVDNHLRKIIGDIQAEEYKKLWKMELDRKMKKFL